MFLDSYDLRARLRPALIVLSPVALVAGIWVSVGGWPWLPIGVILAWIGVGYLMAQVVRDIGRTREPGLMDAWGGRPSTVALRHRGPTTQSTLAHYHTQFAKLADRDRLPTPEEEQADPAGSDDVYAVVVDALRAATRDDRLVRAESINYAYRRNLWALKPAGILLSLGSGVCAVVVMIWTHAAGVLPAWVALLASGLLVAFWLGMVRGNWVRVAALRYCDALFTAGLGASGSNAARGTAQ